MANDDEEWLAALSGKSAPPSGSDARAEAGRLREAMAASRAAIPTVPGLDVEAALMRFEEAARREGLMGDPAADSPLPANLTGSPGRGGAGQGRRRTGLWAGLSAFLVAIGAMLYIGSGPALLGTRGGETVPPMYRADPRAAATALKNDLISAGARVNEAVIDSTSGATRLTVDLGRVAQAGDGLDAVLEKHRVPHATGARFVVEILPSTVP